MRALLLIVAMLLNGGLWAAQNAAPTISGLPPTLIINQGASSAALAFNIDDDGGVPTLSSASSNSTKIPNTPSNISFGGNGQTPTVTITPASGQSGGPVDVTVTVTDGGTPPLSAFQTIAVTINAPPTIVGLTPAVTTQLNTATAVLDFTVNDNDVAGLSVTATSLNTTLVPNGNCVLGGSNTARTLRVTPQTDQSGTAIITVRVTDAGDSRTVPVRLFAEMSVTVRVNAPPSIATLPTSLDIDQYGSSSALPFTIADDATAIGSLSILPSSGNPTIIPAANCVIASTGAATRTLTITPTSGQITTGTPVNISIVISDGEGGSRVYSIAVSVREINRPPVIAPATSGINYSLNVSGYAQILPDSVTVSDPDGVDTSNPNGKPTLKTGSDYLRITAQVTTNRVANEDVMVVRSSNECTLQQNGSNYRILRRGTSTIMANADFPGDGSLTITITDAGVALATGGVTNADVVAWLLKTIFYTNLSGRFASATQATRGVQIQIIEGRPASMTGGQSPGTATATITHLRTNDPPANVRLADLTVSPGGTVAIALTTPIPSMFDDQTANDALQYTLVGTPVNGRLIDLDTRATITSFAGIRLNATSPIRASGIGYENQNPNAGGDGITFQVTDAGGLSTTANVAIRISFGTGEARIISDPLLVIRGAGVVNHSLQLVGPTSSAVTFTIGTLPGFPAPSGVATPAATTTTADGNASATLAITPPAGVDYLAFLLTSSIGSSTIRQPFIIRLLPASPAAAN
jgi:hypothetical protein